MQFRKRDFDGKRRPLPPIPAGFFFCRSCSTIRAESERSASGKRDHCKPCASGAQAKSRASRAAKGLTKSASTKTQSSLGRPNPHRPNLHRPKLSRAPADQIPIDQKAIDYAPQDP